MVHRLEAPVRDPLRYIFIAFFLPLHNVRVEHNEAFPTQAFADYCRVVLDTVGVGAGRIVKGGDGAARDWWKGG